MSKKMDFVRESVTRYWLDNPDKPVARYTPFIPTPIGEAPPKDHPPVKPPPNVLVYFEEVVEFTREDFDYLLALSRLKGPCVKTAYEGAWTVPEDD